MAQGPMDDDGFVTDADRRAWPRIPTEMGVVLEAGDRRVMGVTVDASEGGLQVAVSEPFFSISAPISVRMNLPDAGWYRLEGEVVRSEVGKDGVTLGIRLAPNAAKPVTPAGPPTTRDGQGRRRRVRKSRAKVRTRRPRERALVLAELRALGGHVYEQCILGVEGPPTQGTMEWVASLAWELEVDGPRPAESHQALMRELASLHRRAGAAAPACETVARTT